MGVWNSCKPFLNTEYDKGFSWGDVAKSVVESVEVQWGGHYLPRILQP